MGRISGWHRIVVQHSYFFFSYYKHELNSDVPRLLYLILYVYTYMIRKEIIKTTKEQSIFEIRLRKTIDYGMNFAVLSNSFFS